MGGPQFRVVYLDVYNSYWVEIKKGFLPIWEPVSSHGSKEAALEAMHAHRRNPQRVWYN